MVMSMRAHSTAVQDSLKDYTFGSANTRKVPHYKLSDSQVGQLVDGVSFLEQACQQCRHYRERDSPHLCKGPTTLISILVLTFVSLPFNT